MFATVLSNFKNFESMKRLILSVIVSFVAVAAMAHDKMIPYAQLPLQARNFIEGHFDRNNVVAVTEESDRRTEYEVRMADGTKMEFDGNGVWTKVSVARGAVPAVLVPETIAKQVTTNYPNATIVQIEKRGAGYEIELSDDREMLFDATGNLIKIDD